MRIGVIGAGVIGKRHLGNLVAQPDVQIAAICGRDAAKTAEVAAQYGAQAFTDYQEMFVKTELDAVFICTPPGLRAAPVAEAADRGIACFIEKPPAKSLDEAREIADIVKNSGIIHSVGFMYRYTGAAQKAKELIESTGRPVPIIRSIHVCGAGLIDAPTPRWLWQKELSQGPLFDQGIHLMDATRFVAGVHSGDVTRIHAFGGNVQRPKDAAFTVEENFIVNLSYSSGTIHTHTHSWGIAEPQVIIELLSPEYRLLVDLTRLGSKLTGNFRGEELSFHYADENMYANEVQVFLEAVRTNNQSIVHSAYADAAQSLALVIKANESVDSGSALLL